MSGIRITYSGIISLVMGLLSAFTGLIFSLIVTRTLTVNEYGTWSLIYTLVFGYIVIIEPIISYWATREISRGINSGKTAAVSSSIFSLAGIFIYLIITNFLSSQTNVQHDLLFFAAILIPVVFLNRTLTAVNMAWKPHAISYGLISLSAVQIPAGLIFIYFFHLGVKGIILATLVAYITSVVILFFYAREKLKDEIKKQFLSKWFRLSWLPIYPGIASLVGHLDVVLFSIITRSVEGLAVWSASMIIPLLITNSGSISRAIYPKLLEGGNKHLKENLTQLFYFAIPLTALAITFAKPGLFIINPVYEVAVPVVLFSSIYVFLNTINGVFQSVLTGVETVDVTEASPIKHYVKSKLFLIPTLSLIQFCLYISILGIVLLILSSNTTQLNLVVYWSIIAMVTSLPFTICLFILVKRNFASVLDLKSTVKYLLVSIVAFGLIYVISEHFLIYTKNLFEFAPSFLFLVGLGIGIYLAITYVVDLRTRKLFKAIMNEIKSKKS